MRILDCPGCGAKMKVCDQVDIAIDECPECGGIFLDKGELNILATGIGGNIESYFMSADSASADLPVRRCPVCPESEMKKVHLLQFTDNLFDYCPSCGGFYLEKGSVPLINEKLEEVHDAGGGQEFRGMVRDHLVRIDILSPDINYTVSGSKSGALYYNTEYLKISVFFRKKSGVGLRVHSEKLGAKLARVFKLFRGQDIIVGDSVFDRRFIIEGEDEARVKMLLGPDVRKAVLDFCDGKPGIFSGRSSFWMFDEKIVHLEGPYNRSSDGSFADKLNASELTGHRTVQSLLDIVERMESTV